MQNLRFGLHLALATTFGSMYSSRQNTLINMLLDELKQETEYAEGTITVNHNLA